MWEQLAQKYPKIANFVEKNILSTEQLQSKLEERIGKAQVKQEKITSEILQPTKTTIQAPKATTDVFKNEQ
jgi:hypothetical protein